MLKFSKIKRRYDFQMALPKQKELFSVILKFLSDGQEHKMKDICDYCAEYFNLSDYG